MNILIFYQKTQVATIIIDRPTEGIELDETRSILLTPRVVTVLIQLLMKNSFFQSQFLINNPYKTLQIELSQPVENDIDYKSCKMAFHKVWSQVELEDALHWMSTLGGAYSNLGDHSTDFVSFFCYYFCLLNRIWIGGRSQTTLTIMYHIPTRYH